MRKFVFGILLFLMACSSDITGATNKSFELSGGDSGSDNYCYYKNTTGYCVHNYNGDDGTPYHDNWFCWIDSWTPSGYRSYAFVNANCSLESDRKIKTDSVNN